MTEKLPRRQSSRSVESGQTSLLSRGAGKHPRVGMDPTWRISALVEILMGKDQIPQINRMEKQTELLALFISTQTRKRESWEHNIGAVTKSQTKPLAPFSEYIKRLQDQDRWASTMVLLCGEWERELSRNRWKDCGVILRVWLMMLEVKHNTNLHS